MTLLALSPLIDGLAIPGPVVIKLIPGSLDIDLPIYDLNIGFLKRYVEVFVTHSPSHSKMHIASKGKGTE